MRSFPYLLAKGEERRGCVSTLSVVALPVISAAEVDFLIWIGWVGKWSEGAALANSVHLRIEDPHVLYLLACKLVSATLGLPKPITNVHIHQLHPFREIYCDICCQTTSNAYEYES